MKKLNLKTPKWAMNIKNEDIVNLANKLIKNNKKL